MTAPIKFALIISVATALWSCIKYASTGEWVLPWFAFGVFAVAGTVGAGLYIGVWAMANILGPVGRKSCPKCNEVGK